jgi:catechol 2,3-dioxygenase-like lactoylglutathione lyase family enzyme
MRVEAIDHVQLAMPEGGEDRARAFYGGILGVSEKAKPPHLAVRGGVWFETAGLKLHLGVEKDFRPARKAHPALIVSGLDELLAKFQRAGIETVPDEPMDGYRRAYVSDPFGNRIELMERLVDV